MRLGPHIIRRPQLTSARAAVQMRIRLPLDEGVEGFLLPRKGCVELCQRGRAEAEAHHPHR